MSTTTTSVRYSFNISKEVPAVVILENRPYESTSSSSTTTTNSPVISSHHLELSHCSCNRVITSEYSCSECHEGFPTIVQLAQEAKEAKLLLSQLQTQEESLRHDERIKMDTRNGLEMAVSQSTGWIETTRQGIDSLEHDLKVLKNKCKEETSQVQQIQESKENIEKELEELGAKLTEEADSMIVIEKEAQRILERENELLSRELKCAERELKDASSQLKLIRNTMGQHDDMMNHTLDEQPQQVQVENNVIDTYTRAQVETILMHGLELGLHMDTLEDDGALMDFSDFIQTLYKTPLRKIHSLKYMRYCIRDDIEPCLRFGPNPRLATRKIMDSILVKSCFIEECPPGFVTEQAIRQLKEEASASLWERFTTSTVFLGCQACGRNMDKQSRVALLKYRFRISYFDEWACIDRYCRDRLVAVIEFYLFIRHLRAGAYKHRSVHELYQQSIRLKLQMFLTRYPSSSFFFIVFINQFYM